MQNSRIPIIGLDFRTADHEVKPGMCRVIQNLYPSGEAEFPTWRPMRLPNLVVQRNKDVQIIDGYVWHRANLPSLLIALAYSDNEGDVIVKLEVSPGGRTISLDSATVLYHFNSSNSARIAGFAQAGDALVITVGTAEDQERMLMVRMIDSDVVCIDFNANIPFPRLTMTSTVDTADDSDHNTTLTVAAVYFGVRVAWELNDGTLMGVSPLLVYSNVKSAGKWRKMTFGISAPAVYSDANWKRLVRGLNIYISPYVSSDVPAGLIPEKIANDSQFYKLATLEKVFEGLPTFVFDEEWDTIITKERLEIDLVLSRKSMLAHTLFSYNKRIMYGGVQYVFQAPSRLDGRTSPEETGPALVIPKPDWLAIIVDLPPWEYRNYPQADWQAVLVGTTGDNQAILRRAFAYTLNWAMPPDPLPAGFIFSSMILERRIRFTHHTKKEDSSWLGEYEEKEILHQDWTPVAHVANPGDASQKEYTDTSYFDFPSPTLLLFDWVYNIRIDYRIRARYTNNSISEPVDGSMTAATYLSVEDLAAAVTGGDDFYNNDPTETVGVIPSFAAHLTWKLPDVNVTHRGIEAVRIYRAWSWTAKQAATGTLVNDIPSQLIATLAGTAIAYDDGSPYVFPLQMVPGDSLVNMSLAYVVELVYVGGTVKTAEVSWAAPKPVENLSLEVVGGEDVLNGTVIPILQKFQMRATVNWTLPPNTSGNTLAGFKIYRSFGYTKRVFSYSGATRTLVDVPIVTPLGLLAPLPADATQFVDAEIVSGEQARWIEKGEGDIDAWLIYRVAAVYEGRSIEPQVDARWDAQ